MIEDIKLFKNIFIFKSQGKTANGLGTRDAFLIDRVKKYVEKTRVSFKG